MLTTTDKMKLTTTMLTTTNKMPLTTTMLTTTNKMKLTTTMLLCSKKPPKHNANIKADNILTMIAKTSRHTYLPC